ncbi:hypothetical protein [Streptomyces sp. NBC_00996]|uniref:hypothetical protein n=1 Tax=Streptomyces sp. NBC_00996 TaxID=2903710 RepID=UPI00386622B1|nr:hypothetical protein OG390_40715 [Streptomyces sp. NBC_00996]
MVRISHLVTVEPVRRRWVEQALLSLYELAQETHAEEGQVLLPNGRAVPDVLLVEGRHLAPGAVYESADDSARLRLTVRHWDRRSTLRFEQILSDEELVMAAQGALRSIDRPREAELRGSVHSPGRWPSLRRAEGGARVDLDAWWKATTARRFSGAPLTATLRHRLGEATVRVTPRRCEDGRWEVRAVLTLRGRSLVRPLAAVGLRLFRRSLERAFAQALDDMARQWNETVPDVVAQDVSRLREEILNAVAE